jgi:hypothetical protein
MEHNSFREWASQQTPEYLREQGLDHLINTNMAKPTIQVIKEAVGASLTLSSSDRQRLNQKLIKAGLDGNKNFGSVAHALNVVNNTLEPDGLMVADVVHNLSWSQGRATLTVSKPHPSGEPFMPNVEITNSVLAITWYRRQSGNYEIVAYLS